MRTKLARYIYKGLSRTQLFNLFGTSAPSFDQVQQDIARRYQDAKNNLVTCDELQDRFEKASNGDVTIREMDTQEREAQS